MRRLEQIPAPGSHVLACAGDMLEISLRISEHRAGDAFFRTNLGQAAMRRQEIIEHTEADIPPLARDWQDIPMHAIGHGVFTARIPLLDVGCSRASGLGAARTVPSGVSFTARTPSFRWARPSLSAAVPSAPEGSS